MAALLFLPLRGSILMPSVKSLSAGFLFSLLPTLLNSTKMADKLVALGSQTLRKAKPHLQTFWYYAKVELTPPKISEIPAVIGGVGGLVRSFKSGAWKNVTVKQALLNTLVTTEVVCWFFIGECIGKGKLVGYKLN